MANLKIAVGVNPFVKFPRERDYIEIKHSILARTSFNHTLTTSNFYFLPGNQTNSATVWYLRYQLNLKVVNINWLLLFLCEYVSGQRTFCLFHFFHCSPMKIRPGQADRNEKASSVYRLRQSTKGESMKRGLSASEPFLAVMKGMWPRRPLGWCEPLYPWSSSGSKTTWVGGSNVLGLMGQPRNGPLLPLAFRREVSLVHYCLEESLMISRMPPKARLWLNCNEKSKDNWNFKPTRPLFLCQRWQPAGSSSTVQYLPAYKNLFFQI